jgi:hypothetical protein
MNLNAECSDNKTDDGEILWSELSDQKGEGALVGKTAEILSGAAISEIDN